MTPLDFFAIAAGVIAAVAVAGLCALVFFGVGETVAHMLDDANHGRR